MAVVSVPVANHRGLVVLEVEYDDATVTGVGETWDADLIGFVLTNDHTAPVRLLLRRSRNRGSWREVSVEPGVHRFDAGGPVKKFSDLNGGSLAVDWR